MIGGFICSSLRDTLHPAGQLQKAIGLSRSGHVLHRTNAHFAVPGCRSVEVRQVELRRSGDRVRHNRERGWTDERIGTASSCVCRPVRCGSAGANVRVADAWADESVGKPDSVAHRERRGAIIHLRPLLPAAWCDLPGGSGEQPSGASADARARPLDLAPGGVYRATPVTWGAGGLLHHRFTLTSEEAVFSLWHFPAGHPGWALPTTVLCGVRTFLDPPRKVDRDRLTDSSEIQANACPSIDETRRDVGGHVLDADRRI